MNWCARLRSNWQNAKELCIFSSFFLLLFVYSSLYASPTTCTHTPKSFVHSPLPLDSCRFLSSQIGPVTSHAPIDALSAQNKADCEIHISWLSNKVFLVIDILKLLSPVRCYVTICVRVHVLRSMWRSFNIIYKCLGVNLI